MEHPLATMPVVIEDAPVQIQAKQRPNVQQAVAKAIEDSCLKKIKEGTADPMEWAKAVTHDVKVINDLADMFVADMNAFCNEKMRYITRKNQFSLGIEWQSGQSDEERAAMLWDQYVNSVWDYMNGIINNMMARTPHQSWSGTHVGPFLPISAFRKEYNSDVVDFEYADSPTEVFQRRMVCAYYKCPDDFTRSVPDDVKYLLAVAQTTNFDYKPTILDGVLVSESKVATIQPEDPALVMRTGMDKDLMVSYWKDTDKKSKWPTKTETVCGSVFAGGMFVVLVSLATMFGCISDWSPNGWMWPCVVCYVFGGLFGGVAFGMQISAHCTLEKTQSV